MDTNGDSLISYAEAEKVRSLIIYARAYQFNYYNSLEGLDAFVNLKALLLGSIASTSIDFAKLDKLEYLGIGYSGIKNINVSQNTNLRILELVITCIYDIDLSNNTALERITLKPYPYCEGSSQKNICVWTIPFPPEDVILETKGDPERLGYNFTRLCSDVITPDIVAIDTLYDPDYIQATSSKDGIIYLVPEETERKLEKICQFCIDSIKSVANTAVKIPLSGLGNGEYWLYARDSNGNVSNPEPFTILGVGIEDIEDEAIMLFPNPTTSTLSINTWLADYYNLEIYSLNGQLKLIKEMIGASNQLDLSSFQKGVYFITIRSQDFVLARKIIKL